MLVSQQQAPANPKPLSVSDAMQRAKSSLESVRLSFVGEVSELSAKRGYKAVYFTVKDEKASCPCLMWNNRYQACGIKLSIGMRVELTGRFTLYAPKGRMNFDVSSIKLAGQGDLRQRVEALARKLEAEGLMNPSRKRPIPTYPEHIGVVTSPRGDAVHDVLRTLRRRFPAARVSVAGVPVEGTNAPAYMIEGLRACAQAHCDVVLLVRGGGSFEDLMPFNDEALARTVAASPVPVVTGIGHEPDTSICDMVADLRASTPTAAAEAVSKGGARAADDLRNARATLLRAQQRQLESARLHLSRYASRPIFKDAHSLFATDAITLDAQRRRLALALPASMSTDAANLAAAKARLRTSGASLAEPYKHALALRASRLHDLSPLAVLGRGYAFVHDAQGHIVDSVEGVAAGDAVDVTIADGTLHCTVEEVVPAATPAS